MSAPGITRHAVVAIAGACIADPDERLRRLLVDAIADVSEIVERDRLRPRVPSM